MEYVGGRQGGHISVFYLCQPRSHHQRSWLLEITYLFPQDCSGINFTFPVSFPLTVPWAFVNPSGSWWLLIAMHMLFVGDGIILRPPR